MSDPLVYRHRHSASNFAVGRAFHRRNDSGGAPPMHPSPPSVLWAALIGTASLRLNGVHDYGLIDFVPVTDTFLDFSPRSQYQHRRSFVSHRLPSRF